MSCVLPSKSESKDCPVPYPKGGASNGPRPGPKAPAKPK